MHRLFPLAVFCGTVAAVAAVAASPRDVSFTGYVVVGEQQLVSLTAPEKLQRWVRVGDRFGPYEVLRLNLKEDVLVVRDQTGAEATLMLEVGRVRLGKPGQEMMRLPLTAPTARTAREVVTISEYPAKDAPRSDEGLDWEWLESDANPMRKLPLQPGIAEQEQWPHLSPSEREQLVELYRQCGWHITITHRNIGVGVLYRKIRRPETSTAVPR